MLPRVRTATRKDIPEILRLNALLSDFHVRIDPYYKSGEETAGGFKLVLENLFDDEKTNILVADKGNGLAGYFIGMIQPPKPFLRPEKTGRISDAFVEQAFRGRGLGEKMFDRLVEWFKENGIRHIELSVDARNPEGIGAWRKYGFKDFMIKMRLDL